MNGEGANASHGAARWPRAGDAALAASSALADARGTISAHAGQPDVRAAFLDFVDAHQDALLRTCVPGHLTGSALVVHHDRERVLLHLHRKLGIWVQMGGHCDGDANLAGVAMREACEESGTSALSIHPVVADLDVHRVDPPHEPPHLHYDVRFVVLADAGAVVSRSEESDDLRWFGFDETRSLGIDDGLRRLIAAARDLL